MSDDVAKTAPKQRGRPFQKGQSGNPSGRPAGSRNKASLLLAELIDGEGEDIVRAMIDAAKGGDVAAGRCLMDRLVPPRKDRPVSFTLPDLETAADAPKALAAITAAVAVGDLTAGEAADLAGLVEKFARTIETADLELRVAKLEEKITK